MSLIKKSEPKKKAVVKKEKKKEVVFPKFEGKRILAILEDGRATEDFFHCEMEGRVKMHVPKALLAGFVK